MFYPTDAHLFQIILQHSQQTESLGQKYVTPFAVARRHYGSLWPRVRSCIFWTVAQPVFAVLVIDCLEIIRPAMTEQQNALRMTAELKEQRSLSWSLQLMDPLEDLLILNNPAFNWHCQKAHGKVTFHRNRHHLVNILSNG